MLFPIIILVEMLDINYQYKHYKGSSKVEEQEKKIAIKENHIIYADVLKILASIAVVITHVVSTQWYALDPHSKNWLILNTYNILARWCVPIFIMITGMFLLNYCKSISISRIFKIYIKRIAILIIIWSSVFALLGQVNDTTPLTFNRFVNNAISGHYHLWYLYMIIGLYLVTPILRTFTKPEHKKIVEYFLILWFVFQCIIDIITKLPRFSELGITYSKLDVNYIVGYIGYYLLGYYLYMYAYKLSRKQRIVIYILGIISAIYLIIETKYLKINDYRNSEIIQNYLSALVCLISIAVFVLFQKLLTGKYINRKLIKIIKIWARISLGVYLIHPMFLIFMEKLGITILTWPLIISVIVATIIIYFASAILSFILYKIPIIGKYVV